MIGRLDSVWMEDSTTEITRASVDERIEGDLGHAAEMLSALWGIANEDDDTVNEASVTEVPSSTSQTVSRFRFSLPG